MTRGGVRFSPDSVDWGEVRDRFVLRDDMIYMNCGTEGSMPRRTLECYRNYNLDWASSPSYQFFDSRKLGALNYQQSNRAAIGEFIGAQGLDICLTNNTTMGLSMVLLGLPLNKGDEILTSDHEHWALIAPLNILKERGLNIVYVTIPVPLDKGRGVVDAFRAKITNRTKAIAVSHVTWTTGTRLPVQEVCALAKEKGIYTLIDGAHALGAIALDVTKLACDFYACSGHKWLNGPPGTGVLYIRDAASNPCHLRPIICEEIPTLPAEVSTRLQMRGCNNTPSFAAMVDSAGFADELGRDIIEGRVLALGAYTKSRVLNEWGEDALFSPYPDSAALCSGITTFLPSRDRDMAFKEDFVPQVVSALWSEHRIYVRFVQFPILPKGETPPRGGKRFAIRASTHIFNSFSEIDRLIEETRKIADRHAGKRHRKP